MRNIFLRSDALETVIGLVVFIIWLAANFTRARRQQGRRAASPPQPRPMPASTPASASRSPEEELREFLKQLGGSPTEAPPLPPSIPQRSMAQPQPMVVRSYTLKRQRSVPQQNPPRNPPAVSRPHTPGPVPSAYHARESAHGPDERALAKIKIQAPVNLSSFSLPSMAMPALRGAIPMPSLSMASSSGGMRAYPVARLGLQQRDQLRRAFRLQTILSTPAGLR